MPTSWFSKSFLFDLRLLDFLPGMFCTISTGCVLYNLNVVLFSDFLLLSFSKKRKADLQENTDERVAKKRTEGAIQRRGRSVAAGELWTSGDAMDSWTKE